MKRLITFILVLLIAAWILPVYASASLIGDLGEIQKLKGEIVVNKNSFKDLNSQFEAEYRRVKEGIKDKSRNIKSISDDKLKTLEEAINEIRSYEHQIVDINNELSQSMSEFKEAKQSMDTGKIKEIATRVIKLQESCIALTKECIGCIRKL